MSAHSLSDLEESGLLWLFNESVLHPRGYHIGLISEDEHVVGWLLMGDGTEVVLPDPSVDPDVAFNKVQRFLKEMGDGPGNTLQA